MSSLITQQFEQYIAQQTLNHGTVTFDEFIFANIPGLTENNLSEHLTMPSEEHIVHRQAVSQAGIVNENAVVYSVTIGTEIGDFDFNFIGLLNKTQNILAVAIATNPIKKVKNQNNQQGNSITRSILLEFSGAKALTGINVSAETWQIDFTLRLTGVDEKIHFVNRDLYGRAIFFEESFLVKRKQENQFTINAGVAYVEGVRAPLMQTEDIILSLPCSVYVDVVHHCTVTGAYQTEVKFLKAEKQDYIDSAGYQHYVQILADIDVSGNVTDRRILSPFLGIKPNDLDEDSVSKAGKNGHWHKLPFASLLKKGIVKLYSGNDSESEEMAATPKAVKGLKALIDALTRNLTNYIPNSKKSNAVNSTSSDTVATSYAVKTAYDKGVEAKNAADKAQSAANAAQQTANAKQSPATTLAGYGIADFKVTTLTSEDLNTIQVAGNYGQSMDANATSERHYPENKAGSLLVIKSAYDWKQVYLVWNSGRIYVRNKTSGGVWLGWVRVDAIDSVNKSGDTMTGTLNIKVSDYSSVRTYNSSGYSVRWECAPASGNEMAAVVYATPTETVQFKAIFPKKNGTVAYITDITKTAVGLGSLENHAVSNSGGSNNYVLRDSAGDIVARLLRSNYNDQNNISGAIAFRVNNSTDNYTRYCNSPAAVRSWLGLHASATRAASWSEITGKPTTAAGLGVNDFDARVTNLFTYQKVGNFEIRKYPDGTMIQIYIMKQYEVRGWIEKKFNWAQAFVGVPSIFTDVFSSFNGSNTFGVTVLTKSTNATCYYWEYEVGGAINQGNVSLQFFAIGRWK